MAIHLSLALIHPVCDWVDLRYTKEDSRGGLKNAERKKREREGDRTLFGLGGCSGEKLRVGEKISRISSHLYRKY